MDPITVGKQIAEHRKRLGLTQKKLAELLHITDGAVSKWERGINYPDFSLLEPLATALDTSPLHLLYTQHKQAAPLAHSHFPMILTST